MERLTFNLGRSRATPVVAGRGSRLGRGLRRTVVDRLAAPIAAARERYDADYLWMIAFTVMLFVRPQDQIPALQMLHLAEITALGGLAAMATRRLASGQSITKVNAEVAGVVALGAVMLLTIPFSFWPGGSTRVFSDIYVKIILIFALMTSTLTSPKRVRQITWVLILASAYMSARAIFDYVRGVNLVEGNRVRGALGGMFENPNDLALNLVTFLAPTLFMMMNERKPSRRLFAAACAVLMLGAIVCTKSRAGFLGLLAMGLVVAYYTARVRPGVVLAVVITAGIALPLAPSSFWNRMDSIMNAEEDPTGSRAQRMRLLEQGVAVFAENPVTGIGAGQFQNYVQPGVTTERNRVTHNVWLQVAAELGIFGLAVFAFLVWRAFSASLYVARVLGPQRRRSRRPSSYALADEERRLLSLNAHSMLAAAAGWLVCAFFASVAFSWTFYYVLALSVAGREIVASRRTAGAAEPAAAAAAPHLVRAHA